MTSSFAAAFQPTASAAEDLEESARLRTWHSSFVAAAYATRSGAGQLIGALESAGTPWRDARKVFVVGLDFGLTEPAAIEYLDGLPNSECRIYDVDAILASKLVPRAGAYHPKVYAFFDHQTVSRARASSGIIGSVNLTGAALSRNIEAYVKFDVSQDPTWLTSLSKQIVSLTKASKRVDGAMLSAYRALRPQRPAPPPEEPVPGVASAGANSRALDPSLLRALRAARFFWTQTFSITQNRGHGNPGNQVDIKRGARAFFGFDGGRTYEPNTVLGSVDTVFAGAEHQTSLRFGDNMQDKVNLPVPPSGHPGYADSYLCWERVGPGRFRLTVSNDGSIWKAASQAAGTLFKMKSGREWGFFD